jgi:hypothetical protein
LLPPIKNPAITSAIPTNRNEIRIGKRLLIAPDFVVSYDPEIHINPIIIRDMWTGASNTTQQMPITTIVEIDLNILIIN